MSGAAPQKLQPPPVSWWVQFNPLCDSDLSLAARWDHLNPSQGGHLVRYWGGRLIRLAAPRGPSCLQYNAAGDGHDSSTVPYQWWTEGSYQIFFSNLWLMSLFLQCCFSSLIGWFVIKHPSLIPSLSPLLCNRWQRTHLVWAYCCNHQLM